MAELNTTPIPAATHCRAALRVVLFGMPQAGKSSLLGALAQAAQTQEHLLGGRLDDLTQGLTELQRRLYEDQQRETLEEIVPYPVVFEFSANQGQSFEHSRLEALLVDCDGRVANELLARQRALTDDGQEDSLAAAILKADALILTIDASASPSRASADFSEFGRFLRLLEHHRGQRSEVGGLPVFLVLTKCDLLADAKESLSTWIDHVQARKREVDARFREFLARQKEGGPLPFGRIDLHVWATAVKRPALADAPFRPRDPYGVAELFRQTLECAQDFRTRGSRSTRRLIWTLAGGIGLAAGMLGLAIFLLVHRTQEDPRVRELLSKVESYRMREPMTPSNRLRGQLQLRVSELTELQSDPSFSKLPRSNQEYVAARLGELQSYRTYYDNLVSLPAPGDLHSEKELESLESKLRDLSLPAEYKADWSQTEAVLLRGQRLEQIKLLRAAVASEQNKYGKLVRRGEELWSLSEKKDGAPFDWPLWNNQLQSLLEESDAAQHRSGEHVPGSDISYETVLHFDNVAISRGQWQRLAQRLQRLSNLSAALGLGGTQSGRAPLDIPAGFTASQAAAREQNLKMGYPHFQDEFTLADLPETSAGEIRRAARVRYDRLLQAGRDVVLRRLREVSQGSAESYESWRRLRPWIDNPPELQAWRVLSTVLARLLQADDPVSDLSTFLKQEQFDLTLSRLELEIPEARKVHPSGKLVIHHQKDAEANAAELAFEPVDEGKHDARRQVTRYAFKPSGASSLVYRPGDALWADVPVKSGDNPDWVLTWSAARSQVYQFERLVQPPRLHRKDQPNLEGEMIERITLQVTPDGGLPRVPDLLPLVIMK